MKWRHLEAEASLCLTKEQNGLPPLPASPPDLSPTPYMEAQVAELHTAKSNGLSLTLTKRFLQTTLIHHHIFVARLTALALMMTK